MITLINDRQHPGLLWGSYGLSGTKDCCSSGLVLLNDRSMKLSWFSLSHRNESSLELEYAVSHQGPPPRYFVSDCFWPGSVQSRRWAHNISSDFKKYFPASEFLGRTEIRVSEILGGCEERRGPVTRTLKLLEAESGVITIKLDIQLF